MAGRFIHGQRAAWSGAYNSWRCMKQRCDNPKAMNYKAYGGRGIKYDPRWKNFEAFYNDMGDRPLGHDLSRKDQNTDYTFENCEWTPRAQNRGSRRNYR